MKIFFFLAYSLIFVIATQNISFGETKQHTKQHLDSNFKNSAFKEWDGAYVAEENSEDMSAVTSITVRDCTPEKCAFDASAGFEIISAQSAPGGGNCELAGEFKFVTSDTAKAWSNDEHEFTGDAASIKSKIDERSYIILKKSGPVLTLLDEGLNHSKFCARNTPSFMPASKEFTQTATAPNSPSFECKVATSAAEKIVCATPSLAEKDRRLNAAYKKALQASKINTESKSQLKIAQRIFLKKRNACQAKVACVEKAYDNRIKILDSQM